jgi:hypothetical protein
MWVDCTVCGAKGAQYEDENTTRFCGTCESRYQESEAQRDRERREYLEAKCASCFNRNDCDVSCPVAEALYELRHSSW